MNTMNIKLYDLFRKELKLKDEVAKQFVVAIADEVTVDRSELVTKDFLRSELSLTKTELRTEMSDMKTDMVKWMFAFWIGQVTVIGGLLMYFLKK